MSYLEDYWRNRPNDRTVLGHVIDKAHDGGRSPDRVLQFARIVSGFGVGPDYRDSLMAEISALIAGFDKQPITSGDERLTGDLVKLAEATRLLTEDRSRSR